MLHLKRVAWLRLTAVALAAAAVPAYAQNNALVVVLPEAPVAVEACNGNNTANGRVIRINIYEPLTVVSETTGQVEPRLATSWERTGDLTWRFHLREGVKFHDGGRSTRSATAIRNSNTSAASSSRPRSSTNTRSISAPTSPCRSCRPS
jgi:ABC-type transport system substrate-binding protein